MGSHPGGIRRADPGTVLFSSSFRRMAPETCSSTRWITVLGQQAEILLRSKPSEKAGERFEESTRGCRPSQRVNRVKSPKNISKLMSWGQENNASHTRSNS